MSQESNLVNIGLQDELVYEYVFYTHNKFSISGNKNLICENIYIDTDGHRPYKCLDITVCDDEPTLENLMEFLRFAPISSITHFEYTELVGEEYFFPKVDAILDFLEDRCPNLRNLYVQFQGNPDDLRVFSSYLYKVVNYKNLEYFVIRMALEDLNTVEVIEYYAEEYLIVNGNRIKNLDSGSDALFHWDETTHKPVETLELYECSFFRKSDIIHLLNIFKNELLHIILDIVLPDIFFLYLDWCRSLKSLNISFKAEDSIKSLMGITNLRFLTKLTFENLHIAARPIVMKLFKNKSMKTLQMLQFNNCQSIDDNTLKIISFNCIALQSIGITSYNTGCEISDFGIMSILYNCPSLTRLELDDICGIDGYFLASARKFFPQLENVKITNCSIKSPVCQAEYNEYAAEFVRYKEPREDETDSETD